MQIAVYLVQQSRAAWQLYLACHEKFVLQQITHMLAPKISWAVAILILPADKPMVPWHNVLFPH